MDYLRKKPKWAKTRLQIKCDYCKREFWEARGKAKIKKRHFCSMKCYAQFRKKKMSFSEQPTYKGIRKEGQSKQIYYQNYCRRHPKRIAHLKARRYARERNAIGSHTLEEWENLLAEFDYRCAFCRKKRKLTKDHILPLSEGGTDYIDNVRATL